MMQVKIDAIAAVGRRETSFAKGHDDCKVSFGKGMLDGKVVVRFWRGVQVF